MEKTHSTKFRYALFSVTLAGTFFLLDTQLPLGYAAGVSYIALILIGLRMESRETIFLYAILGTILTVLGSWFSPASSETTQIYFNRGLSIATLWLTVYFCLMNIDLLKEKSKSKELDKANSALKKESGFVQLSRDIALFSNLSRSLNESVKYSLQRICEFTQWPVGHLYLIENNGNTLIPTGIWHMTNQEKFSKFRDITQHCQMAPGEGLPGQVLEKGKAHFIADLKNDPNFPRSKVSGEIGLASGFGFPILIGNTAVGIMEFFSSNPRKPDKRLLEILESIGVLLGRVIERSQADHDKECHSNHLRRLYQKLDSIREEESKRISREVHDNMGQVLTTLKIELSLLKNKLGAKSQEVNESLDILFSLIEKNMEVVKEISRELRPPVLDSLSLTEAIQWQGNLFQEKTGIKFKSTTSPASIKIEEKLSTTLFRILQECMINITRHSNADEVQVNLAFHQNQLKMEIKDNGRGITNEEIENTQSLGLLGMKERAQAVGGNVVFIGMKDIGTTVLVTIPSE